MRSCDGVSKNNLGLRFWDFAFLIFGTSLITKILARFSFSGLLISKCLTRQTLDSLIRFVLQVQYQGCGFFPIYSMFSFLKKNTIHDQPVNLLPWRNITKNNALKSFFLFLFWMIEQISITSQFKSNWSFFFSGWKRNRQYR